MKLSRAFPMALFMAASPFAFADDSVEVEPTRHILNLNDVEMSALIEDVSIVTGYTFIVHPDVRAKRVTVSSNSALSSAAVFDVFLSTLRVHGFAAVPAGQGIYRIVPEAGAVSESRLTGRGSNAFVTEIIKLDNFRAIEAAQMVKPLVDQQGTVVANASSNTVVIVDYASNLPRLREVVSKLDNDNSATETLQLANIPASEVELILNELHGNTNTSEGAYRKNFRAFASDTGNSLVLSGEATAVEKARAVAVTLDRKEQDTDEIRVIPLNNAKAEDVVPILQSLGNAMEARKALPKDTQSGFVVEFHAPTNSLVLSAEPNTLRAMERVVANLDRRRAQVLVEAIIVEMSDDTARELGLQFILSGSNDSTVPFMSTNFSRSAPNILALTGALTDSGSFGENADFTQAAISSLLGINGATVGFGGQSGDTLFGAILTAVEEDTESRILSKPFNMTLDNGTSSLLVGQDVPIATGEVVGDSFANPFRTVERKEIGIGLDVTPRISSDGTIQMDIKQEVSSIDGVVGTATGDLAFNTRKIDTTIIADDGEIIVLGGLIEQSEALNKSKVPILGDIPVAGRLFRSEGRGLTRTNLMVFIRPTIIRSREDARNATQRSYNYIRAQELWDDADGPDTGLDDFVSTALGTPPPFR